ncbi:MAG: helix-turn-helix domain-containing protein [Candidatus Buchananbacteria bacterium]
MKNLDINKTLSNYGFSDKEIKVYLSLLALGKGTVKEIAKESKVKRTSIYPIADKLVEKGILGQYSAKYGTHYFASSPETLISRLDKIKDDLNLVLPQLQAIENKDEGEPVVKFFKGREGYLDLLNDTLIDYSHDIMYIGSMKDLSEVVSGKYIEKYIKKRMERKIKFWQIVFLDEFSKAQKKSDLQELRLTKFFPDNYKFVGNKVIYKNKVAFFSSKKEMICLVVESKDLVDMERSNFKLLWEKLN